MTVAFNIWKGTKRITFKLMRYVTNTITKLLLTLVHCFSFFTATSLVLISPTPSHSAVLFSFSLLHTNFDVASS